MIVHVFVLHKDRILKVRIDPEDILRVSNYALFAFTGKKGKTEIFVRPRKSRIKDRSITWTWMQLKRLLTYDYDFVVEHANGDFMDHRRCNLRELPWPAKKVILPLELFEPNREMDVRISLAYRGEWRYVRVDPEDVIKFANHTLRIYAASSAKAMVVKAKPFGSKKYKGANRIIMPPSRNYYTYVNGDPLDLRKSNLRELVGKNRPKQRKLDLRSAPEPKDEDAYEGEWPTEERDLSGFDFKKNEWRNEG